MSMRMREGGVLILVLMMMVLLVSMIIAFMSLVSQQRGSSLKLSSLAHSEIAMDTATAQIKQVILQDTQPYATFRFSPWYTNFLAVTDPDGDPFTEDGSWSILNYSMSSLPELADPASVDEMVNAPAAYMLPAMIGRNVAGDATESRGMDTFFRLGWRNGINGDSLKPTQRWVNLEYFDDYFQRIEIDATLGEAEKADLRRGARYVMRYCAAVMDLHGLQSINNNYPNAPIRLADGFDEYVKFQNYLRCYGRSIKSQASCTAERSRNGYQYRSTDPDFNTSDPLDDEVLKIVADGNFNSNATAYENYGLHLDRRLKFERIFRGDALKWHEQSRTSGVDYGILSAYQKGGPVYSWEHMSLAFDHRGRQVSYNRREYLGDIFSMAPYGQGLLDSTLGGTDDVSCPWEVNLLTATPATLLHMIHGLSADLKHDVSLGGPPSNADLLGKRYPEPFPLNHEDGKEVNLAGQLYDTGSVKNTERLSYRDEKFFYGRMSLATNGEFPSGGWKTNPAYQNSYWHDVAHALRLTIVQAQKYWACRDPKSDKRETGYDGVSGRKEVLFYPNDVHPSYLDPDEDDPQVMTAQLLKECYRILGEGIINNLTPATSSDFVDPTYLDNIGSESLLAGGRCYVGGGYIQSSGQYQGYDNVYFGMRASELSELANTRGMEYMLNDVMISLFGYANPHYNSSAPNLSNIAVDFNADGYAESTVSGWYDIESNQRIWSWWWDGVGPYVDFDAKSDTHDFMKRGGWYRFYSDGTIKRNEGSRWVDLSGGVKSDFLSYNEMWLTGNASYPIKPFSKTGRLMLGKSRVFQAFVRGEVYNLNASQVMAASHRSFIYKLDPNGDSSFSDAHVIHQKEFNIMFNTDD